MICPRCSLPNPQGTLACARCGEETARPVAWSFDSKPPNEGPRTGIPMGADVPIDRRGRGVRALAGAATARVAQAQARARSAVPHWSRAPNPPLPTERKPVDPPARTVGSVALLSSIHQAKTDPHWISPPESEPPTPIRLVRPAAKAATPVLLPATIVARAAAWAIDAAVVLGAGAFSVAFGVMVYGWNALLPEMDRGVDYVADGLVFGRGLGLFGVALLMLLWFVYTSLSQAFLGATLGKHLLGLRLVLRDGESPTATDCLWRAAASCFSVGFGGAGVAMALFDSQHLSFHDRVVGTRVVRATTVAPEQD